MEKQLFSEYSEEQRLQMLQDNCEKALEDYGYEKPLSKGRVFDVRKDHLVSGRTSSCKYCKSKSS